MGKENMVLWGLSQGCATSLASLLVWDGEPFAGIVGICEWLPYANEMLRIAGDKRGGNNDKEEDDLFVLSGIQTRIHLRDLTMKAIGRARRREICLHRQSSS